MVTDLLASGALFVGLLVGLELGRGLGRRARARSSEGGGLAAADGVVFAMLGLLIAFTFTHSASRFDVRRELIVEQANAWGTAWLRLDVLPPADRLSVQEPMRQWLLIAADFASVSADPRQLREAIGEADRAQQETWRRTVDAVARLNQPAVSAFVLSPLNDWIDLTTKRLSMDKLGLPPMVLPTLMVLSFIAAVLAGFGTGKGDRWTYLHMFAFAVAITFAIYIILDLNGPRDGLIRVDGMDQLFVDLLKSTGGNP